MKICYTEKAKKIVDRNLHRLYSDIKMKKLSVLVFICISPILVMSSCDIAGSGESVAVEKGFADLSDYSFASPLALNGEWELYTNKFLEPSDFRRMRPRIPDAYVTVPSQWSVTTSGSGPEGPFSHCTYRIVCSVPRDITSIGIKTGLVFTSFRLYINGNRILREGRAGRSPASSVPMWQNKTGYAQVRDGLVEIIMHVSNYDLDKGGIYRPLHIARKDVIESFNSEKHNLDMFLFGAFFILGLYHLILFLLGKHDFALLFFGLFCFVMLARLLVTDEVHILHWLPELPWVLLYKTEVIAAYLGTGLLGRFLSCLFPRYISHRFTRGLLFLMAVWSIIALLLNPYHISTITTVFQILLAAVGVYVFFKLVVAALSSRPGAGLMVVGFALFYMTIVMDILLSQGFMVNAYYSAGAGLLFFILSETVIKMKFVRDEQLLIQSEVRNEALLSAHPDTLVMIKADGDIIDLRSHMFDFDNPSRISDILGQAGTEKLEQVKKAAKAKLVPVIFEYKQACKTGEKYYEVQVSVCNADQYLLNIRDITEHKLRDLRLYHTDKLVSLGTLTAGVAHEINNPNNAILLTSQTLGNIWHELSCQLTDILPGDSKIGAFNRDDFLQEVDNGLLRISRNSRRIKDIIEELKNFYRKGQESEMSDFDINDAIHSALRLMKNTLGKKAVSLTLLLAENLPRLRGYLNRMEQVCINIVQNAMQALIEPLGSITIKSDYDRSKNSVCMEVIDTGTGIPEELIEHIIDPFFTTKRDSGGTGLGLSISNKIINDHKGRIVIKSREGEGTSVRVYIPVYDTGGSVK